MATNANKVRASLLTTAKAPAKVSAAAITPAQQQAIDTAIGKQVRAVYAASFDIDGKDATTTLSDEYLGKIDREIRKNNPTVAAGHGADFVSFLSDAIATAETADSNAESQGKISDITVSGIRSSAKAVAEILGKDAAFAETGEALIAAEHVRKQGPGRIAFILDRLFITRAPDRTVLVNFIDANGTAWGQRNDAPWPKIGTKEGEVNGVRVVNPDLVKKEKGGYQSWYSEVVRCLPLGKNLAEKEHACRLACANPPSGKHADQSTKDYLDPVTAERLADQYENASDNLLKYVKRSVEVIRTMLAINAMPFNGDKPPRLIAEFAYERQWDNVNKKYIVGDDLSLVDSNIRVRDPEVNQSWEYSPNELLAIDLPLATTKGGTLNALRTSVGRKKNATGAGQGGTPAAAATAKVILKNVDVMNYFAALATTFETSASRQLFERTILTGKEEETNDALTSAWRLTVGLMNMFATQPQMRERIMKLEHMSKEAIDDIVGLAAR